MERPPESLKAFANSIASAASSEDAAQIIHYLHLAGLLREPTGIELNDPGDMFASPPNPNHVGVWERKIENGKASFVRRREMMHEWSFWANQWRIEEKGAKRRVVLIGESVARGYLYDPMFNPASALQMILDSQFGENEIEVIDLARTGLSYKVKDVAISALKLEPDAVIIFSGNNWASGSFPELTEMAEQNEAEPKSGIAEVKRLCEARIKRRARRIVNDVASAYAGKGIPLIWIIPEFNLADWRDPITNAPHLAEGLNRKWHDLLDEAHGAMRDRDFSRAEGLAKRMVEIDGGVCVASLYILAECSQQLNAVDAGRKYLELARDAALWDLSRVFSPRPYSIIQEVLREEASKWLQNQVVDLPALFKEYLDGGIPGRQLLIDYCHLTSEGMRVVMAAAAACVVRSLKGEWVAWQSLADERIAPPPQVEAEASFLAAILNAHFWQPYEVVHYYCARALKLSPHVAELMLDYIEFMSQSRRIPVWISRLGEQIYQKGSPLMRHFLPRLDEKRLDRVLLDAVVEALGEVGIESRERLERLRREEHSVKLFEANLLDFYYCSSANQPHEVTWLSSLAEQKGWHYPQFYKAYWPESRFVFVGEAGCSVHLSLTCRLPRPAPPTAAILVGVNGKPQVEADISSEWGTWEIGLAGEDVHDGINEVTVRWPTPVFAGDEALKSISLKMCTKKFPDFYPIFGEIHSFMASHGRDDSTNLLSAQQEPAAVEIS